MSTATLSGTLSATLFNALPAQRLQSERQQGVDTITLGLWFALLLIGVAAVGSASMEKSMTQYHYAFGYLLRHCIFVSVAIVAALATFTVPLKQWLKYGRLAFPINDRWRARNST